jgi:flagellar basal body-associated protein FliL
LLSFDKKCHKTDDDGQDYNDNSRSRKGRRTYTIVAGSIAAAIILVTSLLAVSGTMTPLSSSLSAASAQVQTTPPVQNQTIAAAIPSSNLTDTFTSELNRIQQQARIHNQQQAVVANLTAQTKQKARDVSNAVDGILIYYARAVGEKYKEPVNVTAAANAQVLSVRIPVVPLTGLNTTTSPGGGVKIVSIADYLITQGLAIKAIESFTDLSASVTQASPDALTLQHLSDTQEGLSILYSMVNSKVPYNLLEDAALSPVKSNLDHVFGASATTIS